MSVDAAQHRRASATDVDHVTGRTSARLDIQGLRCVAVLAVALHHLLGWPSGGFVGVDVFFVISGYLITGLLLREHRRTGHISFRGFYARRVKRVVPAAMLVLGASVFASWLLLGWGRTRSTAVDAAWSALFAGNWRFEREGTDYFALGQLVSPLQHYWSLGVEEQFYFVWPWLLLLVFAVLGRSRSGRRQSVAAGVTIAALSIVSFAWALAQTESNPTGAYFSSLTRAWELGVGALLATNASFLRRHLAPAVSVVLSWVGFVAIVASLFVVRDSSHFPAPWAALPVLATALVIAAGENERGSSAVPLLTNRFSVYVGDISYSLYLWHFPVIILLLTVYPADSLVYYGACVALIAVLSVASYHLVENPIRRSAWLTKGSGRSQLRPEGPSRLQATAVGLLVLATAAVWARAVNPEEPTGTGELPALAAVGTTEKPCLGAASLLGAANCDPDLGDQMYPLVEDLADDSDVAYACFANLKEPVRSCTYGSPDAGTRVAVVGDSHAAALLMPLRGQTERLDWSMDTYLGVGCRWNSEAASGDCPGMADIQGELLSGDYDIVITSAYRRSGNPDKEAEAASLARLWAPVAAAGARIVAVGDVPNASSQIPCLYRVGLDVTDNDCSVSVDDGYATRDALRGAVELVPGATYLDTERFFCTKGSCPLTIGNVLVYRDEVSHVSDTYAETLSPFLGDAIVASAQGAASAS